MIVIRLIAAAVVSAFLVYTVRWISGRSRTVGLLVAGGLLARAAIGLLLFWVSYLNLPVLRSLQLGDGFWTLMGDARGYYRYALVAATDGLHTVVPGMSSPFYTKTLATWMDLVGISSTSGLLLNLCFYVTVCAVLTHLYTPTGDRRQDLPLLVALVSISFSPVVLIHATQTLKEDLFLTLILGVCLGAAALLRALVYREVAVRKAALIGTVVLLAGAIYAVAGIRSYYAVIVCGTLFLVLLPFALRLRGRALMRALSIGALTLAIMWTSYWAGAGPYYRPSPAERARLSALISAAPGAQPIREILNTAVAAVDGARVGFVLTGGATNMKTGTASAFNAATATGSATGTASEPNAAVEDVGPISTLRLRLVGIGIAVVFVPVSLLRSLSIVEFDGGRGLLPLADLDTLVMDLSLIVMLWLVYSRRGLIGDRLPLVAFGLTLSVITAVLLGYVVTNFGTLFRMRYLVAVPVWAIAIALAPAARGMSPGAASPAGAEDRDASC